MAFIGNFELDKLPQSEGFAPIPAGWYQVRISACDVKATKDGSGEYVRLTLDVLGPSHQGRKVFTNLNLKNKNADAERIAHQQLGDIMKAGGLSRVTDTDQLVGVVMDVKLVVKEASGGYDASNEVKGFRACEGSVIPMPKGTGVANPFGPPKPAF